MPVRIGVGLWRRDACGFAAHRCRALSSRKPIRVLVVDDHAIVREGWKRILADHEDISVEGEAGDGDAALAMIREQSWDVVVLDINLPGRDGLDILRCVDSEKPDLPVLVVSFHSEKEYAQRVLSEGASGYLTKSAAPNELVQAVQKVAGGGRYVSRALAEHLVGMLDRNIEPREPHRALTESEFRTLRLIAEGHTYSEIAGELCISLKTVSTHRASLLDKLGLRTDVDIHRYCQQYGLIE